MLRGKLTLHVKKKGLVSQDHDESYKQVLEFVWISLFDQMEVPVFYETIMWITDLSCLFLHKKFHSSAQDTHGRFIIHAMSLTVIHVGQHNQLLLCLIQMQYIQTRLHFCRTPDHQVRCFSVCIYPSFLWLMVSWISLCGISCNAVKMAKLQQINSTAETFRAIFFLSFFCTLQLIFSLNHDSSAGVSTFYYPIRLNIHIGDIC